MYAQTLQENIDRVLSIIIIIYARAYKPDRPEMFPG